MRQMKLFLNLVIIFYFFISMHYYMQFWGQLDAGYISDDCIPNQKLESEMLYITPSQFGTLSSRK